MLNSFEAEIKRVLDQIPADEPKRLAMVAEALISAVENQSVELPDDHVTELARFLLLSGLYKELIQFVLRHFREDGFPIPWPYFLDAIHFSGNGEIPADLADALIEGIDGTNGRISASRSKALDHRAPTFRQERADRRVRALKAARRQKEQLLEQLVTLRTQQLFEQERQVLQKLQKMYPQDAEVLSELRAHKERYALEILARHSRFSRNIRFQEVPTEPELEAIRPALSTLLREAAEENPILALDFAVAAAMLEMWEEALTLLEFSPDSVQARWLRLELLLSAGRHLELLQEIARVELLHAEDAETFFATSYLRAQALWGLGQKHTAIEVMESLLAARPHYRAGLSLLSLWRDK